MMTPDSGLYPRVLGPAWHTLAEPVRLAHATQSRPSAHGWLRIERGSSLAARVLSAVLRLPRASDAARTRRFVTRRGDGERWQRTFEDRSLASDQYPAGPQELRERFGILELLFRLEAHEGSLVFRQVRAEVVLGPIRWPIPSWLAPLVHARERPAAANQIHVDVRVTLPRIGLLLTYAGLIDLAETRT